MMAPCFGWASWTARYVSQNRDGGFSGAVVLERVTYATALFLKAQRPLDGSIFGGMLATGLGGKTFYMFSARFV